MPWFWSVFVHYFVFMFCSVMSLLFDVVLFCVLFCFCFSVLFYSFSFRVLLCFVLLSSHSYACVYFALLGAQHTTYRHVCVHRSNVNRSARPSRNLDDELERSRVVPTEPGEGRPSVSHSVAPSRTSRASRVGEGEELTREHQEEEEKLLEQEAHMLSVRTASGVCVDVWMCGCTTQLSIDDAPSTM